MLNRLSLTFIFSIFVRETKFSFENEYRLLLFEENKYYKLRDGN